jgi:hypothetical protein
MEEGRAARRGGGAETVTTQRGMEMATTQRGMETVMMRRRVEG